LGTKVTQRFEQSANRIRDVFVGADQWQKVSQPRWRLTYLRSLGGDVWQRVSEHRERLATGETGCWSQDGVESGTTGGGGDGLGDGAVIRGEVVSIDTQMRTCRGVSEVEDVKVD
jgi:hypothetical protein